MTCTQKPRMSTDKNIEASTPDLTALNNYLQQNAPKLDEIKEITRFTGGYSNLTYNLKADNKEYHLRTPPIGVNIKSAQDMGREFRVLSLLKPHYDKVPTPIIYCESTEIIGAPFYVMEKLSGTILRAYNAPKMNIPAETMHKLSASLVDNLVALHALDIKTTGLNQLGKPEGYVQRQVDGW